MFHNAENLYQQYTGIEYAKIFCLNRKKFENAWKCPKLVPKRYSEILREPSACYVDHVYGI